MQKLSDTYFANLPAEDFVEVAQTKIDDYYQYIQSTGIQAKWKRVWRQYHGQRAKDSNAALFSLEDVQSAGSQGELSYLNVNHYRNVIQHVLTLTTAQRPAFDARPINSDYKSQTQAILGNGILDYYLREKDLEVYLKVAVEHAILFGEGHVLLQWDQGAGQPYAVNEDGRILKEGDISYCNLSPFDVIRDVNSVKQQRDWVIARKYENRFNLAARYPEQAEDVLSVSDDSSKNFNSQFKNKRETDERAVYIFMHARTDAVPSGRLTIFCENGVVLLDGGLPYREIPLFSILPNKIESTQFGYTPAFDGLQLQEAINVLSSTIYSNQKTFGVQNIWQKPGNNLTIQQLSEGMNLLESLEKPEPLQLTATPGEIFNFRNTLINEMETVFGINSVVRGNPEASLKSGSALALVVSQAVQFNSGLQQAYNQLLESTGTSTLMLLRDFAKTKRVASILGRNSRPFQKEFSGDDLAQFNRVVVEQASAVSKTSAGRIEIANQLLQTGLIRNPEEYLQVINTGKLEPLIESQTNELLLIRSENEELRDGNEVQAILTERHDLHVQEHMSVLSNPESKKNPLLVANALSHIQQHIDLWKTMDPSLLQLLKMQPAPQGVNAAPNLPQTMNANPAGNMPNMPNMPSTPPNAPAQTNDLAQQAMPPLK
jgi:hypothetical protein